jgi:predicted nucleic acid-binding protein
MPRYLADTSIWTWAWKPQRPDITAKLSNRVSAGEVVTCVPVALEVMHRPDTRAKYEQMFKTLLDPLDWLTLTEEASLRAMDVQQQLAAKSDGGHRRPAIDFLIAAIAELHDDIVLWAFDNDYAVIAGLTQQPVEIEVSTGPGH